MSVDAAAACGRGRTRSRGPATDVTQRARVGRAVTDLSTEETRAARHRALADSSRLALLRVLEAAEAPLDIHALAEAVGLHANTVRWHLGILIDADLVTEVRESTGARGRPRHGYRFVPGVRDEHPGGFRLLADVLAEVLSRGADPATIEAVGRERGRALVGEENFAGASPTEATRQAVATVVRLLELFGFQPRVRRERGGHRVDMRPCPFGETAVKYTDVVCPLHLGLMRGVLDRFDTTIEATGLEAFVKPDLCVAHLARRPITRVTKRTK
jgi:predicted ArsR family transcriptional regulator